MYMNRQWQGDLSQGFYQSPVPGWQGLKALTIPRPQVFAAQTGDPSERQCLGASIQVENRP
ncbi:hypothetical protein M413DRAFT_443983 [Hebeloma cylindrosporum]|uniref:Uncharacterized protein n=1 Tax=Hebeloma cylindrosporum TaxID=76867 RepID=A0A0C3CHV6_HEBCY|nr:hypothetical protein M413DRAFT_443983 [Hebeloma cylindrosporum h7]